MHICLVGRKGGPTIVYTFLLSIFSTKHITGNIHTCKFIKGHFLFFGLELQDLKPFKPKIFWVRTPPPPALPDTSTISKLPRYPCVCIERLAIVQKTISYRHLTCMERRFKQYFCRMFSLFSVHFRFVFFFRLSKMFGKFTPPPRLTKIPGSAPVKCTAIDKYQT